MYNVVIVEKFNINSYPEYLGEKLSIIDEKKFNKLRYFDTESNKEPTRLIDLELFNPEIKKEYYGYEQRIYQLPIVFDSKPILLDPVDEETIIRQAADFRKARLVGIPTYDAVSSKLVSIWKRARLMGKNGLPFMTPAEKQITFQDTQYATEKHRILTPRLQEIFGRQPLRIEFMGGIDDKCAEDTVSLTESALAGEQLEYDVVIVGSGPHGALAATEIREKTPNAKILIIDKSPRLGGQFRQYGDQPAFFMNSRVRRASRAISPIPRTPGDINPMGDFAPLQLSDVVRRIYADNTQIGDITAINAFLSANSTLIGTEVREIKRRTEDDVKEVVVENSIGTFTLNAKYVIEATGVSQKSSINNKETRATHVSDPSYWQTADIYQLFGSTKEEGENALEPFDGKRVALIGGGDSALTTLEAMLGVLPEGSYGMYGPGRLSPKNIVWLGAPAKTAAEIDNCLRSRYKNGIIQALPKTELDNGSIIQPIDQRVIGCVKDNEGNWVIYCTDGSRFVADVLIDCTNDKNGQSVKLQKDGSIRLNLQGYGGIYQVGPGSSFDLSRSTQALVRQLGIGENTVALWARAPETAKIAREISRLLKLRIWSSVSGISTLLAGINSDTKKEPYVSELERTQLAIGNLTTKKKINKEKVEIFKI